MATSYQFAHYCLLSVTAIGIAACSAERPTSPSGGLEPRGPQASLVDVASASTLYSQDPSAALLDANAEAGKTTYLADDFVVPTGKVWMVQQVGLVGSVAGNFTSGPIALSFRADDNGKPGTQVPNGTVSATAVFKGSQIPAIYNYIVTLSTAIALPEGKYWLAIVTGTPEAASMVQWQQHSVVNSTAVGSNDGGVTWQPRDTDFDFALFGTAKFTQTIVFTSTTPAPGYLNGTYDVGATGGASGNSVVITVAPTNVCTVNANVVSFVGVGACTITANQAGSATFDGAAPVSQLVKVDYRFDGFLDGVRNGDILNSAKAGQVIALKWRLTDANGNPVTSLATLRVTVDDLSCALGATSDQLVEQVAGGSGLQNIGNGYYQYNWKSPASYAKSCKAVQLDLGEGSGMRIARFAFTK